MEDTRRINGYTFELNSDNNLYECRGDVYYDDDHDECAEPGLMAACKKLSGILETEGYETGYGYQEKGWVDVQFSKNI